MQEHDHEPVDEPLPPEVEEAIEAELKAFADEEATRMGVGRAQFKENLGDGFWASQKGHTTLLISGLSLAHDQLATSALRGLGFNVERLDTPDTESLQYGKEFGNRGQCNPTYFTVGNLVKHLVRLRDVEGMTTKEIVEGYVFLTAGGCGPCRFGMYVTEYRKALRDAGFDGFRVLLFQMAGGVRQATGEELGLKIDGKFAWAVVRALIAGDIVNLLGYRMRPYEVVPGSTDAALEQTKALLGETFERNGSVAVAMARARRILGKIEVDYSVPKPVVSVIGEFWAMTTEGDGNYHMHRFLEQEGAEVQIQSITNWLLFLVWEAGHDTKRRMHLRGADDEARKSLKDKDPTKKLWGLVAADKAIRGIFSAYATALGLHNYHLPDIQHYADLAGRFYDLENRGGESFLEVGKVVHFVEDKVNHMTVSVKPFGCMPSSGVSDGVQSFVTAKWPEAIFIPIETTGDSAVNAQSRVQMMLFRARVKAREEFDRALDEAGLDEVTFKARVARSLWRGPFLRPGHKVAGTAANLAYAVARPGHKARGWARGAKERISAWTGR